MVLTPPGVAGGLVTQAALDLWRDFPRSGRVHHRSTVLAHEVLDEHPE
jgi:hypothetical protein